MWLPGLLLSVLVLAASQVEAQTLSPCLVAQANRPQKNRPIVRRKSKQFKTVLALDGGDVRATIQTAVLCEVEQSIKRSLMAKRLALYKSIDDFDILLSDYFDVIAGTSAGTYLVTYLGTDGGDAKMAVPSITAMPGSALGAYQFMQSFGNLMRDTPASIPTAQASNYTVVGTAFYKTFDEFFYNIYGNRTLQGPFPDKTKASLLYTWSRISAGAPEGTSESGMAGITAFLDSKNQQGGLLIPKLNGVETVMNTTNFNLWQCVRGSTSWPPRVPAYIATTTPESPEQATFAIVDGAVTAMDPAVAAFPFMLEHQNADLKRLAILSIGTGSFLNETVGGTTFPVSSIDWITGSQNSVAAWSASLASRYRSVQLLQGVLPQNRYLRIDQQFTSTTAGDDCAGVFTDANCSTAVEAIKKTYYGNLPTYTYIGATWAQTYANQIDAFVRKYVTF